MVESPWERESSFTRVCAPQNLGQSFIHTQWGLKNDRMYMSLAQCLPVSTQKWLVSLTMTLKELT